MENKVSVFIADDHPLFRRGLKDILLMEEMFYLVGETGNGLEVIEIINDKQPDVAILDIDMPGKNGLEITEEISKQNINTKVVILSMYGEEDLFRKAVSFGARGYVVKDSAVNDIIACVKTVDSGKLYISPSLSHLLLKESKEVKIAEGDKLGLNKLSQTESKILKLIARDKTTNEIAQELHISPKTVGNHRSNIISKLSLSGANALLKFALENKEIILS